MTCYSVQLRDRRFVKGYGFLSFVKNMGRNRSKNLSSKYSQKLLGHAKQPATDPLKTSSERVIQKTVEAIGYLIGNKIADKLQESRKLHHRIIQKQMNKQGKILISRINTKKY